MEKKQKVLQIIAEAAKCNLADIQEDSLLTQLPGWSSLAHLMVLSYLLEEMQIDIPIEKALEIHTVADFLQYVT
ncbi:MAG: acyl carrier protein [Clostridium sp.]|jgi:acyl carrier protein|nr:acyl carrier protein [Clostridium sp.]